MRENRERTNPAVVGADLRSDLWSARAAEGRGRVRDERRAAITVEIFSANTIRAGLDGRRVHYNCSKKPNTTGEKPCRMKPSAR